MFAAFAGMLIMIVSMLIMIVSMLIMIVSMLIMIVSMLIMIVSMLIMIISMLIMIVSMLIMAVSMLKMIVSMLIMIVSMLIMIVSMLIMVGSVSLPMAGMLKITGNAPENTAGRIPAGKAVWLKEIIMGGRDYVPANDAVFDKWFKFMNQYVNGKCSGQSPEWTHIPQEALTTLTGAYAAWYTAYSMTIGPHTKVDTEAKNDAKKAAKAVIRPFVNQYLRFPPVTDEDRTAMGIPNHDNTRTRIGAPATKPVFAIEVKTIRSLTIPFHEEGVKSRGIPYGFNGAVVSWDVPAAPVTDPKKLTHSELATRSPHVLSFEEADRGKMVYIALQWQNESGRKGKFTAIQTAFIP
jgi:hypothetical protein